VNDEVIALTPLEFAVLTNRRRAWWASSLWC